MLTRSSAPPVMAAAIPPPRFDPGRFRREHANEPRVFSGQHLTPSATRSARLALQASIEFTYMDHQQRGLLSTIEDRKSFFRAAILFLDGPALTFAQQAFLSDPPATVLDFLTLIDRRFLPPDGELSAVDDLLSTRQQPGADLVAYTSAFDSALRAIPPDDRPSELFCSRLWLLGLRDTALATHLRRLSPTPKKVPDLLARAHQFLASAPPARAPTGASAPSAPLSLAAALPSAPRRLADREFAARMAAASGKTLEENDRLFAAGLCFHCAQPGHIARACPNKPAQVAPPLMKPQKKG